MSIAHIHVVIELLELSQFLRIFMVTFIDSQSQQHKTIRILVYLWSFRAFSAYNFGRKSFSNSSINNDTTVYAAKNLTSLPERSITPFSILIVVSLFIDALKTSLHQNDQKRWSCKKSDAR